ncbi:MAG: hypothetical protein MHM6MM_008172 [Cercozoa sp. M6MM]
MLHEPVGLSRYNQKFKNPRRTSSVARLQRKKMARLYSPAVFVGFRRSNHVQRCQQALVKIEGVKERADVDFYLGKRVAYVYKVASKKGYKVIVGKIVSKHGTSSFVPCFVNILSIIVHTHGLRR